MAHEVLKKQYEEDCKNHNHPWSLWEFFYETGGYWKQCIYPSPDWHPDTKYRRKKPAFQPEYFSGLDREKAVQYCGRKVGYSSDGLRWENGVLELVDEAGTPFRIISTNTRSNFWVNYIKTIPKTHTHPTITITVNNRLCRLPKPETEAPRNGATAWIITPFHPDGYVESVWQGFVGEQIALEKGYVHLTEDRAQAWADWWEDIVVAAVIPVIGSKFVPNSTNNNAATDEP
jgi:hypothetical protein